MDLKIGDDLWVKGNKTTLGSGAGIVNDSLGTVEIGKNAKFIGNTSAKSGGAVAIYNGKLILKGGATFSGNKVGSEFNDIHNEGNITVEAGVLTLDGDISGDGTLILNDGSSLNVKVGSSQDESTTISNAITIGKDVGLTMTFAPGYVGEYALVGEEGSITSGEFVLADNAVFDVAAKEGADGVYEVSMKSVGEIAANTGANANQAGAIGALMSASSSNEAFNEVATAIGNGIQSSDAAVRQVVLDAATAMSPEVAPMVQQVESDVSTQVFNGDF